MQLNTVHFFGTNKFFIRFFLIYFILYIIPYGLEYIPIDTDDYSFWENITIWFGEKVIGWELNVERLFKGFDSKYDFSRFILIAILALLLTISWMFLDHIKLWEYNSRLKAILQTILRYHLGFTLILYGIAKVFPLQFGVPDIDSLSTDFGDFRPMSLLWSFMSYSRFYTSITGWVEVLGGIFLLFRKTTFLGVFLCFIAMVNVVIIDIGYDVTVKMFAIHLLIMASILMADHFNRITSFLFLNRDARPFYYFNLFSGKELYGIIIKVIVIAGFSYFTFTGTSERLESVSASNPYEFISGSHTIKNMIVNGDTLLNSNPQKWRNISMSGNSYRPDYMKVTSENTSKKFYKIELDSTKNTISFIDQLVETNRYDFKYEEKENNKFVLRGTHFSDSIILITKIKKLDDYFLIKNKRSWIRDL